MVPLLSRVTLKLPTLMGFINVNASRSTTGFDVVATVPCNTAATLCVPLHDASPATLHRSSNKIGGNNNHLMLDGAKVSAVVDGRHLCTEQPVGCGVGGQPRRLSTVPGT